MTTGFFTRQEAERYSSLPERMGTSVDDQRKYLARQWLVPQPCPNCQKALPLVDAIHLEGDHFQCAYCPARLLHTVPLFATGAVWRWTLEPGQIT